MNAWKATIEELRERAGELRGDGWTVAEVPAAETTPEPVEPGDSDRFGLVYVAPDDAANPIREAVAAGDFNEYRVYHRDAGDTLYLLTVVRDEDSRTAVALAGGVDTARAAQMAADARKAGEMYSHVQLLDWTHLGSFRHDDPEPFLPDDI